MDFENYLIKIRLSMIDTILGSIFYLLVTIQVNAYRSFLQNLIDHIEHLV